jgi:hypothetical protein
MKIALNEAELVEIANSRLRQYPGYEDGMKIDSAKMVKHILVLHGEFFFDENNSPSSKSIRAMQVYDDFSREFGNQYVLSQ